MPVAAAHVILVLEPFLQLPVFSNGRRDEFIAHRRELGAEVPVHAEDIGGGDGVVEKVPDEFLVVGHGRFDWAPLGRPAVGSGEPSVRHGDEMIDPELGNLLHDRVGARAQILAVLAELEVLPQMVAIPRVRRSVQLP